MKKLLAASRKPNAANAANVKNANAANATAALAISARDALARKLPLNNSAFLNEKKRTAVQTVLFFA